MDCGALEAGCSMLLGWRLVLCGREAMALQDVVGECVPEDDCADLFDASYGELPQIPVAPAGVDAFADRAVVVLRLPGFARHSRPPSQHAWTVSSPRQIGIGAVFGFRGRTRCRRHCRSCRRRGGAPESGP